MDNLGDWFVAVVVLAEPWWTLVEVLVGISLSLGG